jgi:glyoxylase-like metal-dependent hydrolase (beta-lactamase superfamily II)
MGIVNVYFVKEDDGLTVIDTALSMSAGKIVKTAAEIGAPIQRIVITHDHMDHIGGLDKLHALVPDAEVIVSARTAEFMRGEMELKPDETVGKLRGGYVKVETTPTRTVDEGEMIGSLQVVTAPGHSPDQIALLDTRDQSLIAGDAYVTLFGTVVSGKVNWLFPLPAFATWHKGTALETAKKLRALNPSLLAVGHGKVLTDPLPEMDKAIAAAEKAFGDS